MTSYLAFTLAAPLASFGSVAVGERRPTWDRPSRSQIVGFVASALGIPRTDEARQRTLVSSLRFAVRIDNAGVLATDYHTAQTAKEVEIKRRTKKHGPVRTRADELDCDDLKTILSRREFRVGSLYTIALWRQGDSGPTLQKIAEQLATPEFAPFAGRKAFPLMLPTRPLIVEADQVEAAFPLYDAHCDPRKLLPDIGLTFADRRPIYTDIEAADRDDSKRIEWLEHRRDIPETRDKWRFGLRTEALLRTAATNGESP